MFILACGVLTGAGILFLLTYPRIGSCDNILGMGMVCAGILFAVLVRKEEMARGYPFWVLLAGYIACVATVLLVALMARKVLTRRRSR